MYKKQWLSDTLFGGGLLCALLFLCCLGCVEKNHDHHLLSPDGRLTLSVKTDMGKAYYRVTYDGQEVLEWSPLGVVMDGKDFFGNLSLTEVTEKLQYVDRYTLLHGKKRNVEYHAFEKMYRFENEMGEIMTVVFRVSDDGVAFQYRFDIEDATEYTIEEEKTGFTFPQSTVAWLQPMAKVNTGWEGTNPSYEEEYLMATPVGTPSPLGVGWVYPALFKNGDVWALISEAALERNYCGTRLSSESGDNTYQIAFPDPDEVFPGGVMKPTSSLPWHSPWRILAIGSLQTIVESTLGTDLASPEKEDRHGDFVLPGQASWSWALGKDESITYEVQKAYIEYAADMGWQHCLIDVDWDTTIGYKKIEELVAYADSLGVRLHLWYNSAGSWNTAPYHPRGMLLTREGRRKEFEKIKAIGIVGVKIDFFGGDGQSMMAYYHDILEDAGEIGLMVNFHGTTLPRGWHRTYPYLMTMESVKGFEMISFDQGFADRVAAHCTVLPFTRNVFDPMDFTPMVLDSIPRINRRTSQTFELALSVVFQSGIQHFAESPPGMAKQPDRVRDFLRNLPGSWNDVRLIEGFPGEYVVMGRLSAEGWYLAGINAGESREIVLDLDEFQLSNKELVLFQDADGESGGFDIQYVNGADKLTLTLGKNQGFVLKINI